MIDIEKFNVLKDHHADHCVSLYIQTEIVGDYEANTIRWKNAVNDARDQLMARGMDERDAKAMLKDAYDLIEKESFWRHQSSGLAGFYSPDHSEYIHLALAPDPRVSVSERFLVYPLLQTLLNDQRAYILALSQNEVRFFEAFKNSIVPINIDGLVPKNLDDATRLDDPKRKIQWHSTGGGRSEFHGQGGGKEREVRLGKFLGLVDEGLETFLVNDKAPLVLATVEENQGVYRKVTNYNYLSDFAITMNPESSDPVALHTEILPLFEDRELKHVLKENERYELKKSQDMVSTEIQALQQDAEHKRIDTLFISNGVTAFEHLEDIEVEKVVMPAYESGAKILFAHEGMMDGAPMKAIRRF